MDARTKEGAKVRRYSSVEQTSAAGAAGAASGPGAVGCWRAGALAVAPEGGIAEGAQRPCWAIGRGSALGQLDSWANATGAARRHSGTPCLQRRGGPALASQEPALQLALAHRKRRHKDCYVFTFGAVRMGHVDAALKPEKLPSTTATQAAQPRPTPAAAVAPPPAAPPRTPLQAAHCTSRQ